MQSTNRIILNTIILYSKIVVCMAISLWTVPLVLNALGQNDFGLYNLVAGVITMLAFLNGAMTISTQRYLSVTIGEKDSNKLLQVYNISLLLHIIIGVAVVILVEMSLPLLFDNVLKIDTDRIDTAHMLFHYLVISMFFTILTVPFDAVLNAYENMLAFSVIGVIESVLRLAVALCIPFATTDKLQFYGFAIMGVAVLIFLIKAIYTHYRYHQLYISLQSCRNRTLLLEMFGFAGWNTIASISMVGRNQGLAMVLNHFFGTLINASYGIANQINGVLGYFSQTIQKSVNPQLMESHGTRDFKKLQSMTYGLTKFSTMSMGIVAVPLFIEMPYVLDLWLKDVPPHTVSFARLTIVLSMLFQLSSGLMSAVQSSGRIKYYTLSMCLLLLSVLPISYAFLKGGSVAETVLLCACILEALTLFVRAAFAQHLVGIRMGAYLMQIVLPQILLNAGLAFALYAITLLMQSCFLRLAVICAADGILYLLFAYFFILAHDERSKIDLLLQKLKR